MKWNGKNYRVGTQYKQDKFNVEEALKSLAEKTIPPPVWRPVLVGVREDVPAVSPSVTPTNTPTPSITPTISVTPSITPSVTPSITPSITPSVSVTPSITPSVSLTPSISVSPSVTPTTTVTPSVTSSVTPTSTPQVTPSPTQFCKRYTGVQTTVGNGSTYVYTACNNFNGALRVPNTTFGSTVTVYSRSGAPTRQSGTGVMTWTDQGFGNPCSGSSFYQFSTSSGINSEVDVTDCGGATYRQVVSQFGSVAGCFTSYNCVFTCGSLNTINQGNCS